MQSFGTSGLEEDVQIQDYHYCLDYHYRYSDSIAVYHSDTTGFGRILGGEHMVQWVSIR